MIEFLRKLIVCFLSFVIRHVVHYDRITPQKNHRHNYGDDIAYAALEARKQLPFYQITDDYCTLQQKG
jgi:hypothetical protein